MMPQFNIEIVSPFAKKRDLPRSLCFKALYLNSLRDEKIIPCLKMYYIIHVFHILKFKVNQISLCN